MEYLLSLDHVIFLKINAEWTHSLLDRIFPFITDLHKIGWVKIVALAAILVWLFRGRLHAALIILGLGFSLAIADATSYRIIKPMFERPRPPVELAGQAIVRTERWSGYSFPSNHAANMFAAALFLTFIYPSYRFLFFFIAVVIAYSRVYVGVHFPLDVTVGAIVGLISGKIALEIYKIMLKTVRKLWPSTSFLPDPPSKLR